MTKGEEEGKKNLQLDVASVADGRLEKDRKRLQCSREGTKLLIHLSSILKFKIRAFQIFLQLFQEGFFLQVP